MRRHHAISPGFSGHYQDLGTSSSNPHDSACNVILSVVRVIADVSLIEGQKLCILYIDRSSSSAMVFSWPWCFNSSPAPHPVAGCSCLCRPAHANQCLECLFTTQHEKRIRLDELRFKNNSGRFIHNSQPAACSS